MMRNDLRHPPALTFEISEPGESSPTVGLPHAFQKRTQVVI